MTEERLKVARKNVHSEKTQTTKHTNDATGFRPKDEHEEGNNLTWPGDTTHTTKPTKHKKTTGAAVEEQHKLSLAIIRRSTKTKNENNTHPHTHTHNGDCGS